MQKTTAVLLILCAVQLPAQPQRPATPASGARISDIQYEVAFDRASAADRSARVSMSFTATGPGPILLSLPAWTPGAYEISNFAKFVMNFSPKAGDRELTWDKTDFDTWRVRRRVTTPERVTVTFDVRADTLDNAMAWARDEFLMFNGTTMFLFPEGQSLAFRARVAVRTEDDWQVVTGMTPGDSARTYTATNYHDLVDMPFFVGRFDVDSAEVSGKWMRFATYPSGSVQGEMRRRAWDQLQRATPPMVAVFGEAPWDTYTVMQIADSTFGGASGLEHSNSHVDIFSPMYLGSDFQPSLYAHEIFHAWNVKRLRPAELWPYRYDAPMPTTWLWVSEGITDYYADLALVRGGIVADTGFLSLTAGKINEVDAVPAVALEDASLSTWVHPVDGTGYVYYPKGSLAGLMLDIQIRNASNNRRSLDDVMRELYNTTYRRGRGFTREQWWSAVSRAANGLSFAEFERRYVDGREKYPWRDVLPLAGLRLDSLRAPRLGVTTTQDERGVLISAVDPEGAAGAAGVRAGDYLLAINDLSVEDQSFGQRFRAMFANATEGQSITLRVRRGSQTMSFAAAVRMVAAGITISVDPAASAKATRIREGILRGTTETP
ncbi:MAG TPA: PDZ domain-containing protein [Gemmatimonadaceae bacterium]|nr:PDZ domain-containing protein [Gemmatimonadaceae bacterium]